MEDCGIDSGDPVITFSNSKNQTNNSETGKIRIDQRKFFTREIYINQIGTEKISMQSIYSAFLNKNTKEHAQILTCNQAYQIILSTSKFNLIIIT